MELKYYKKVCKNGCDGVNETLFNKVANDLGIENFNVTVIRGIDNAISDGIPEVPAILIDGKIVHSGWTPTEKEVTKLLKKYNK